jgi:hypothetical protein
VGSQRCARGSAGLRDAALGRARHRLLVTGTSVKAGDELSGFIRLIVSEGDHGKGEPAQLPLRGVGKLAEPEVVQALQFGTWRRQCPREGQLIVEEPDNRREPFVPVYHKLSPVGFVACYIDGREVPTSHECVE